MQTEPRYEELRKREAEERKRAFGGFDPNEGASKRKRRDSNEITVGPEKCKKGQYKVQI